MLLANIGTNCRITRLASDVPPIRRCQSAANGLSVESSSWAQIHGTRQKVGRATGEPSWRADKELAGAWPRSRGGCGRRAWKTGKFEALKRRVWSARQVMQLRVGHSFEACWRKRYFPSASALGSRCDGSSKRAVTGTTSVRD